MPSVTATVGGVPATSTAVVVLQHSMVLIDVQQHDVQSIEQMLVSGTSRHYAQNGLTQRNDTKQWISHRQVDQHQSCHAMQTCGHVLPVQLASIHGGHHHETPPIERVQYQFRRDHDQTLVVTGNRMPPRGGRRKYQQAEIEWGPFERRVRLAVPVDGDRAEAAYERGVLTISLPIAEQEPQCPPVVILRVHSPR